MDNIMPEYKETISFTEKQLPDLKDWKLGKVYRVEIQLKLVGTNIEEWGETKGKVRGRFEIQKVKSEKAKNYEDMTDEEFKEVRVKMYGK